MRLRKKRPNEEAIEKQRIIEKGIKTEFWGIIKEAIERELENGRDALESPIQYREINEHKPSANIRNDLFWVQYLRGNINALRFIKELPGRIIESGEFARRMGEEYKASTGA